MQEVFLVKEQGNYGLGNQTGFVIPQIKSVNYGLGNKQVLGSKIWQKLPTDLKNKESVDIFKIAIKKWKPKSYFCRLCKTFLQNIG